MFGRKKTNQKVTKKAEETVSQKPEEIIKEEKTEVETEAENKKTSTDKKVNKKSKSTKITQSLADFLY